MTSVRKWLEPWYAVEETDIRAALERQLRVEVSPAHVLHGESGRLVARRSDTDDALFALADGRVAEVHLTWKRGSEQDPRWPTTAVFASLEAWASESMRPLHEALSRRR